jgi:hypothetical protein
VKVSIGGWGGDKSYDLTWDLLTEDNIEDFAQGMVDFCHSHGLAGVDFDYEEFKSAQQETLVGKLIARFKALDPNLQASLCSNAGTNWQTQEKVILDAAVTYTDKCPIDRFYIMSYYDPIDQEESWILNWADFLKGYNCGPEVVGVGVDDFDAHAYDPEELKSWALSMGYSTAHWAYDPAHPSKRQLARQKVLGEKL